MAQATPQTGKLPTAQQPAPAHKKTGSSGTGFTPNLARKPQDGGSSGSQAFFFLNKSVPSLVIEIDAVRGYEPTQAALTLLNQRLTGVADKPGGIQFLPVDSTVQARDSWGTDDMKAAESKHRRTHNSTSQASIYILYVNGDAEGPFIGVAHTGSSVGIMQEMIRGAGTPVITAESIEKAVLIHEVGHLLSLINAGYKSPRNHEDPEHPGHSSNQESVMYWAIESPSIVQLLGGDAEPSNAFDKDDLADLADVKSGKLG